MLLEIGLSVTTFVHADVGVKQIYNADFSRLVRLYAKAKHGDAEAQYTIAVMYDNGEGVVEDDKEALKWYRKAAEQGYFYAQNNLCVLYD